MKRTIFAVLTVGLSVGSAWAHHSFAAAYDTAPAKAITIKGTIKEVLLRNPHSFFVLSVKEADGSTSDWAFEAGTPSGMIRNGFDAKVIKVGAEVTIKGFPARDATQKRGMLQQLILPDGKVYGMFGPQEGAGK